MSELDDVPEKFRYGSDDHAAYRAWLDPLVREELLSRLTETPKTWPEIVKGFPGEWLPGRENSLGRTMAWLSARGALNITRTRKTNMSGFEWEEVTYSINALQRLATL